MKYLKGKISNDESAKSRIHSRLAGFGVSYEIYDIISAFEDAYRTT
jgi:hypothetical protein